MFREGLGALNAHRHVVDVDGLVAAENNGGFDGLAGVDLLGQQQLQMGPGLDEHGPRVTTGDAVGKFVLNGRELRSGRESSTRV